MWVLESKLYCFFLHKNFEIYWEKKQRTNDSERKNFVYEKNNLNQATRKSETNVI